MAFEQQGVPSFPALEHPQVWVEEAHNDSADTNLAHFDVGPIDVDLTPSELEALQACNNVPAITGYIADDNLLDTALGDSSVPASYGGSSSRDAYGQEHSSFSVGGLGGDHLAVLNYMPQELLFPVVSAATWP
ncbi:hypothetical protein NM208_g10964 [Fusarium decemcellulare]|uniref:Uncharacterized protein n=1 Tax=Fusarium decemcellulare TaxID=57161 RepID=A0ACC1RW18_9HYPO|nr:hypothetical protein NM208_g10964 [Fusarium decemcellulare]